MSRAIRRHHAARLKRKWVTVLSVHNRMPDWVDPRRIGLRFNTPHPCSCTMGCANQRACEGPTMQERRAFQAFND